PQHAASAAPAHARLGERDLTTTAIRPKPGNMARGGATQDALRRLPLQRHHFRARGLTLDQLDGMQAVRLVDVPLTRRNGLPIASLEAPIPIAVLVRLPVLELHH